MHDLVKFSVYQSTLKEVEEYKDWIKTYFKKENIEILKLDYVLIELLQEIQYRIDVVVHNPHE